MPECRVVPCYKLFLRDLEDIMSYGHFTLHSPPPMETFGNVDMTATSPPRHFSMATETTCRGSAKATHFRFSDSRKDSSSNLNSSKVLRRQVVSAWL